MAPYRKLYLWLSSILFFFLLSACHLYKYHHKESHSVVLNEEKLKPVFTRDGNSKKFKATIDVLNNHFSGLIIIKQTDSLTKHIVFITELGMTMFNFELRDTSFKALYVFEPLNNPKLISALKANFKNMLLSDVYDKPATCFLLKDGTPIFSIIEGQSKRFFIATKDNYLLKQETFHKRKRVSKIDYLYLNPKAEGYTQIKSIQYGIIKIRIELNQILD